jgi:AraC family transcriptional regulator
MTETQTLMGKIVSPLLGLDQQMRKALVSSSQHLNWNGILVEQYQNPSTLIEAELPAQSDHLFSFNMGTSYHLTQKHDDRLHDSIVRKGDSIFVPAGQPTYLRCQSANACHQLLLIHLKPELVGQVAETSELETKRINLVNCFAKQDLQLHHVAMLLLAELKSNGIMGRLYAESLTQVLVIHLLRHYSTSTPTITSKNRSLTRTQLQQAIDYVHAHLDRDLSLAELASVINIAPTYFASLFKQEMGISPHQYVIQQRVEQAKSMLSKTDLAIADIALQVGFSSQSHLTKQFKRITGITPKQVR